VNEYIECTTLAEHLREMPVPGRLAAPDVRRWVREVAAALDHAQASGVAHGDLGPASVLVCANEGRAMVTGFGMAGLRAAAGTSDVGASAALLQEIAGGAPRALPSPAAAGQRYGTAGELAEACLRAVPDGTVDVNGHRSAAPPAPAAVMTAPGLDRAGL